MRYVKIIGTTMVLSIVGAIKVVQDACALVAYPMASDAKRFHAVPNGRKDSRSSMLHPAAPPPTFGPLAKWPAPWFNAGTQRTTQTDQQEKRCIA